MVRYVGVADMAGMVRLLGLGPFMARLAEYMRGDLLRWAEFDLAPRTASHSPGGVIELMPAADGRQYGFKFVNGHPGNTRLGLQTVTAFGALADVATGLPVLLAEMTLATALRTAAASALAAGYMARRDSRCMALIGAGAQAEFQVLAFHAMLGIDRVRVFDIDPAAVAKLRRNLAGVPGLHILAAASVAEAVRGADIVTTVTADKTRAVVLADGLVRDGMHLNAVGGDCPGKTELDPAILRRARVVVEYLPQSRIEGEIQQLAADAVIPELWEVVAGLVPGRASPAEVTVFDSVGFALEDFSTLRLVQDLASETGLYSELDLVPALDDPKDLFGLIGAAVRRRTVPA